MIRQAAGDRDRAEASFLKAVYLDAQHDEALLALALLARRRGDVAAESAYRRRAERVLVAEGGAMSAIERGRRPGRRRLLEPDRRQRRRDLPRAGGARPLPELPGLRRAARGFFDRRAPEGYLDEWAELLGRPGRAPASADDAVAPGLPARAASGWRWRSRSVAEVTDAPAGPPGPAPDQPGLLGPGQPPGPVAALRLAARPARGRPARPGRRARRRTPGWS